MTGPWFALGRLGEAVVARAVADDAQLVPKLLDHAYDAQTYRAMTVLVRAAVSHEAIRDQLVELVAPRPHLSILVDPLLPERATELLDLAVTVTQALLNTLDTQASSGSNEAE